MLTKGSLWLLTVPISVLSGLVLPLILGFLDPAFNDRRDFDLSFSGSYHAFITIFLFLFLIDRPAKDTPLHVYLMGAVSLWLIGTLAPIVFLGTMGLISESVLEFANEFVGGYLLGSISAGMVGSVMLYWLYGRQR
jgi:hypothetical protein